MGFYNGTTGDVKIGSFAMHVNGWEATSESTELETTTVADAGFFNAVAGKRKCSGTFTAPFDSSIHAVSVSPFREGTTATVKLEEYASDTTPLTGTALITKVKWDHKLDSIMNVTCDFVMQGSFKLPGET